MFNFRSWDYGTVRMAWHLSCIELVPVCLAGVAVPPTHARLDELLAFQIYAIVLANLAR